VGVGIDDIALYAGRLSLDIEQLACARGRDPNYPRTKLMCERRSVYPDWEDAVTLSVNAASQLFSRDSDREQIGLLIVGTESAVDFGKPVATWVHRFCKLPAACRTLEVKHACYGGTGALMLALLAVAATGKKALVVSADCSRNHVGDGAEFICGGCAVAVIVGAEPGVMEVDPRTSGHWTREVADTFRPTARVEVGNSQLSLCSYLDALEGAYGEYEQSPGSVAFPSGFERHIYHAPFPAMAAKAHTCLAGLRGLDAKDAEASFRARVEPGLRLAKEIGSQYGASTFVSLLGLLSAADPPSPGDRVSIFAYGSGCQGEFYHGIVGSNALRRIASLKLEEQLQTRVTIGVAEYEDLERARVDSIDARNYEFASSHPLFRAAYGGRGLLVLREIQDYRREYGWT